VPGGDEAQARLRRIGAMLASYDIDELLGPTMAMAQSRAAVAAR